MDITDGVEKELIASEEEDLSVTSKTKIKEDKKVSKKSRTTEPIEHVPKKYLGQDKYKVLQEVWGYEDFRDNQAEVIQDFIDGKDVINIARTGSGKALHKDTRIPLADGSYTTMGQLEEGMEVLGRYREPTKVLKKFQPKVEGHYRIGFNSGMEVKSCKDHLWLVSIPTMDLYDVVLSTYEISTYIDRKIIVQLPNDFIITYTLPIEDNPEDYYCITVDASDKLFLITDHYIPTHNTICYSIPALVVEGLTIVISPLLSLMKDSVKEAQLVGLRSATINSTIGKRERRLIFDSIKVGNVDVLIIAPESILLIDNMDFLVEHGNVSRVVVDEVHLASSASPNFRPQYRAILAVRKMFDVPIMCLTATASKETYDDFKHLLRMGEHGYPLSVYKTDIDRPNFFYHIYRKNGNGLQQLLDILSTRDPGESVLIYCTTKNQTEDLALKLYKEGYKARAFHSTIKKSDKDKILHGWLDGSIPIVVGTSSFGTGINNPNLSLVVLMSLPMSIEDFAQIAGRGGRVGQKTDIYAFYSLGDAKIVKFILTQSNPNPNSQRKALQHFKELEEFYRSNRCYRKQLLEYFDQDMNKENCGSCSHCVKTVPL